MKLLIICMLFLNVSMVRAEDVHIGYKSEFQCHYCKNYFSDENLGEHLCKEWEEAPDVEVIVMPLEEIYESQRTQTED